MGRLYFPPKYNILDLAHCLSEHRSARSPSTFLPPPGTHKVSSFFLPIFFWCVRRGLTLHLHHLYCKLRGNDFARYISRHFWVVCVRRGLTFVCLNLFGLACRHHPYCKLRGNDFAKCISRHIWVYHTVHERRSNGGHYSSSLSRCNRYWSGTGGWGQGENCRMCVCVCARMCACVLLSEYANMISIAW